ncbi:MAG: hypothetical protein ACK4F9_02260 [Brevinematia bacterium]
MKRMIFLIIFFILSILVFASESRLGGFGYLNLFESFGTSYLIDDPFNIVSIPGYVNVDYNYLIVEPKPGGVAFVNTYGVLKYSIDSLLTKFNLAIILNYPYLELAEIPNITTGVPAGFFVPGTTSLQNFSINDNLRDRIDLVLGVGSVFGIKFVKPYIGLGYASDYSISTSATYSGDNIQQTSTNLESIYQYKFIIGGVFDLGFISLDANIKTYLPYAENSTKVYYLTVQNYVNSREHKTTGAFGIDIFLQPRLNLGKSYILGVARYFNYQLLSEQITKRDTDGNGVFEENTSIINNIFRVIINLGASYNFSIDNIFVSAGFSISSLNYSRVLKAGGYVNVPQSATNANEYNTQDVSTYLPVFVSFEVPLVDWFYLRAGFSKIAYQDFFSVVDGKKFDNRVTSYDNSSPLSTLSLGFSLKPLKSLSLDWVVSYNFVNNVLVNGRLPWIISGNNFFDNVTSQFSVEYRM